METPSFPLQYKKTKYEQQQTNQQTTTTTKTKQKHKPQKPGEENEK